MKTGRRDRLRRGPAGGAAPCRDHGHWHVVPVVIGVLNVPAGPPVQAVPSKISCAASSSDVTSVTVPLPCCWIVKPVPVVVPVRVNPPVSLDVE